MQDMKMQDMKMQDITEKYTQNSLFVGSRICSCSLQLVAVKIQLCSYDHCCPSRKNDARELCRWINFRRPLIGIISQQSSYVWCGKIDWVDLPLQLHPIAWFDSSDDRSVFHRFHAWHDICLVLHFHVLHFHALTLGPSISCPAISCHFQSTL